MIYGIAFGSNLGHRLDNLRQGAAAVQRTASVRILSASPVYETAPVNCPDGSGAYLNAVAEIDANLEPHELQRVLQSIEVALGRPSDRELNAPRSLDLDILYIEGLTICDTVLQVPHPRMHQRRFVLQPLSDIRYDLVPTGCSLSVASMLSRLDDDPSAVLRVADESWARS
jgi:2-amino-4-hydroxy-6-hydroxymethyldihydropteridine diphosphokinase